MRSICGWVGYEGDPDYLERLINDMGRRMDRSSGRAPRIVVGNGGALGVSGLELEGNIIGSSGRLAAVSGYVDWRDSKLAEIADRHGAAAALLSGFDAHGPDVLKHLSGAFNVAIVQETGDRWMLATDRAGANPVAYAEFGGTALFGPDAATLALHPKFEGEINRQAYFDYVYFHFVPSPESIYRGVKRLFPGQYVGSDGGPMSVAEYWRVDYDESAAGRSFPDLRDELRDLVRASVAAATGGGMVGAFLSGGVDSSTIVGVLSTVQKAAPRTYTIGFDEDDYDELAYARIAAKHFNAEHREYLVTPADIVEAVPKIAAFNAEPFGNSSAVPSYFCARMAKEDGIDILLGGDGGDELFGGNERYAKQRLFAIYDRVPKMVKKSLLEPILLSSQFGDSMTLLHKGRRYIEQAAIPMPNRLQAYNFLNHFQPGEVFDEDLLAQVFQGHPLEMLTEFYDGVRANTIVDKMLGLDLKFTLADNDLVKVNGACDLAGIGVRYPLLSDDLLDFSSRLPPKWKLKGQVLRYFFKKAYEGFLPVETLNKSKQGFGLPFGEWAVTDAALGSFVRDNLESLKSRRLVKPSFIDRVMTSYLPEHPQYYGTIAWLLLMLEQWHQHHYSE